MIIDGTRDGTIIVHCVTFSLIYLAQNRSSISQPIRQLLISIQNLIQLKSSLLMQACEFLNPETLNSIFSWNFPIRDFPILLRNHVFSNSQTLLLLIVIFFLQLFQPLCTTIMFLFFLLHSHSKTLDFDLHQIFHYFLGFAHSARQIIFSGR